MLNHTPHCPLASLALGLLAEPPKALLYPQLLLACLALLQSSVVRVVELAMLLLLQVGTLSSSCAAFAASCCVGLAPLGCLR